MSQLSRKTDKSNQVGISARTTNSDKPAENDGIPHRINIEDASPQTPKEALTSNETKIETENAEPKKEASKKLTELGGPKKEEAKKAAENGRNKKAESRPGSTPS